MRVRLTTEHLESLDAILSDERSRCLNTLRSFDGRPAHDAECIWWRNELEAVESLISLFGFDADNEEGSDG